jgi:hypothetical protein
MRSIRILGTQTGPETRITAEPRKQAATHLAGARLAARLREKRSTAYVEAIGRLDAGVHQQNAAALQEIIDAISAEFQELGIEQRPLGTVSRCYLGEPYEVHRCDLNGNIIEHFKRYQAMPPLFERARGLAAHGAYAFIEIYVDSLRAVGPDGSVAVL